MSTTTEENTKLVKYEPTDAAIAELKTRLDATLIDCRTPQGYEAARRGIGECRALRVAVEKKRVALKADALEYGRRVDSEAKRITAMLEAIEDPLQAKKDAIDNEKKRIAQEAEEKRLAAIRAEEERLIAVAKAERDALVAEENRKLEEQRAAIRAEQEKLAAEKARIEAEQAAERAKLEAERKAQEAAAHEAWLKQEAAIKEAFAAQEQEKLRRRPNAKSWTPNGEPSRRNAMPSNVSGLPRKPQNVSSVRRGSGSSWSGSKPNGWPRRKPNDWRRNRHGLRR